MKVPDLTKGLVIATLFAASVSVSAVAVIPGDFVTPVPTMVAGPGGSATLVSSMTSRDTDLTGYQWEVEVESRVYSDYGSNPLGGYTFEYRFSNVSDPNIFPQNTAVNSLFLNFEQLSKLDIGYLTGGGTPPVAAFMAPTGQALGWLMSFGTGGLGINQFSSLLVVHSPWKGFAPNVAFVVGSGSGQAFEMLSPAVPEPSTYASLFALGLVGFAAYRRFGA